MKKKQDVLYTMAVGLSVVMVSGILLLIAAGLYLSGCGGNNSAGGGSGIDGGSGGNSSPYGAFNSKQANVKTHELGEACYEPYEETCTVDRSRVVKCEKAAGGGYAWTMNESCDGNELCVVKFGNDGGYYKVSCEYTASFCNPSSGSCHECALDEEYGIYKCQDIPDVQSLADVCEPDCDKMKNEAEHARCCQCCVKDDWRHCSGCGKDLGDGGIADTVDSSQDAGGVGAIWYDPASNLTWQVYPSQNAIEWDVAESYCIGMGEDWRLPTISELRSLIRGCANNETGGPCGVTDSCLKDFCGEGSKCASCANGKGPDSGCYWPKEIEGICSWYWSSSPVENNASDAWVVSFDSGYMYGYVGAGGDFYVRCVRSGQ